MSELKDSSLTNQVEDGRIKVYISKEMRKLGDAEILEYKKKVEQAPEVGPDLKYINESGVEWGGSSYFIQNLDLKIGEWEWLVERATEAGVETISGRKKYLWDDAYVLTTFYRIDQMEQLDEGSASRLKKTKDGLPVIKAGGYILDDVGENWGDALFFKRKYALDVISRQKNLQTKKAYTSDGSGVYLPTTLFSEREIKQIFADIILYRKTLPKVNSEGVYIEKPSDESEADDSHTWVSRTYLLSHFKISSGKFKTLSEKITRRDGRHAASVISLFNLESAIDVLGRFGFVNKQINERRSAVALARQRGLSRKGLDHNALKAERNAVSTGSQTIESPMKIARRLNIYPTYVDRRFEHQLFHPEHAPDRWAVDEFVVNDHTIFTDSAKHRWATAGLFIKFGVAEDVIHKVESVAENCLQIFTPDNATHQVISVEAVTNMLDPIRVDELTRDPITGYYHDQLDNIYTTDNNIKRDLLILDKEWDAISGYVPSLRVEEQKFGERLFDIRAARLLRDKFFTIPEVDIKTGIFKDEQKKEFATTKDLAEKFKVPVTAIDAVRPQVTWIRGRNQNKQNAVLLAVEETAQAVAKLTPRRSAESNNQAKLEKELKDLVVGIAQKTPSERQKYSAEIKKLISIFGSSNAIDILYKFRPEFMGLPAERVRGCLAEYLGDFLVAPQEFHLQDVGVVAEYLSDATLRECLFESIKADCLKFYFNERRRNLSGNSYSIINSYLDHVVEIVSSVANKDLDDVLEDVLIYFASAIRDFRKPEKFVDRLSAVRDFPDINQRINMKEIAVKKRLLIADEMGLGKSASVIMAKEQLGVGCALVIVPSVVRETWREYLSASTDAKHPGYFKPGAEPRVLYVDSPKQLQGIRKNQYDYVVITQERISVNYVSALLNLDPDMLIIDEIHKMKELKGSRTQALLPLAEKLEGADKYVVMLSGTPIPDKIKDVALVLKLLYPDRYSKMPDAELVSRIIRGDVLELRKDLVRRMQMKKLEDTVDMPPLVEQELLIRTDPAEADTYEALLEVDEITAHEKMQILRQFLMNPEILESTPKTTCSKIEAISQELTTAFQTKNKIVVMVNGYIEGVVRGQHTILDQLALPPEVEIAVIHGGNREERAEIQERFNNSKQKMLLVVSGKTADVGVSFVGGEEVVFYNLPWTESDRRQQVARVYRPGLKHPLTNKTLIAQGTIEEGIQNHIRRKHLAVEKVLKGVPISDLDQRMLQDGEEFKDADSLDVQVNPELARFYFSWRDKLRQMYGFVKEIGEDRFRDFLEQWGADYAEAYRMIGSRSYQSNVNRVASTLFDTMIKKGGNQPNSVRILDLASGPEMLRRHIGNEYQDLVYSIDLNAKQFVGKNESSKKVVGSWVNTPFTPDSFDYINLAMAFHYSEFVPSKGKLERVNLLREINRVLRVGGRVVISMIYSMQLRDQKKFEQCVAAIGFRVVPEFSGMAESENSFSSQIITLEKITTNTDSSERLLDKIGKDNLVGFKFDSTEIKLRSERNVPNAFVLGTPTTKVGFVVNLNDADRVIVQEERSILDEATRLRNRFKSIKEIPAQEIIEHDFVRILIGKTYHLFKRLTTAPGVVIVK